MTSPDLCAQLRGLTDPTIWTQGELAARHLTPELRPYFYRATMTGPLELTDAGRFLAQVVPHHPFALRLATWVRCVMPPRLHLWRAELGEANERTRGWGEAEMVAALEREAFTQRSHRARIELILETREDRREVVDLAATMFTSCPPRGLLGLGRGYYGLLWVALWASALRAHPTGGPGAQHSTWWAVSTQQLREAIHEDGGRILTLHSPQHCTEMELVGAREREFMDNEPVILTDDFVQLYATDANSRLRDTLYVVGLDSMGVYLVGPKDSDGVIRFIKRVPERYIMRMVAP